MGYLYHGSSTKNMGTITPHQSTHGNFVYATPHKELAVLFSKRCGDDLTYSLYKMSRNEPWKLVERIPFGFETMYDNSSSIYTISDETFKDIHTGFDEVVSEESVETLNEEYIESVYEEIKKFEQQGLIEVYHYPNIPKEIPNDNSDLIDKIINICNMKNQPISNNTFDRLLYLHPNLLDKVNMKLEQLHLDNMKYKPEDLVDIFEQRIFMQLVNPNSEEYIKSATLSISTTYPELSPLIEDKLSIINKTDEEKISLFVDSVAKEYSPNLEGQLRERFSNDNRPFSEVSKEIIEYIKEEKIKNEETSDDSKIQINYYEEINVPGQSFESINQVDSTTKKR